MIEFNHTLGAYLKTHGEYLGKATFTGLLFDLGEYPAAIYLKDSNKNVHGDLFKITRKKHEVLETLDEYEGNQYIRKVIPIAQGGRMIQAYCYLYKLPYSVLKPLESGDYLKR